MKEQDYFAHPSAYIDEGCVIGKGVKIWHFSHLMSGCIIGDGCNIGQNVVISPKVVLGKNVRVQNNVSIYEAVISGNYNYSLLNIPDRYYFLKENN